MARDKQYPNGATRQRAIRYAVSLLPDGYTFESRFWDVIVEYRGRDRWAVTFGGQVLSRSGAWAYDRRTTSEHWLATHRFEEHEALALANKVALTIKVNGLTAEQYIEWCAKQTPNPAHWDRARFDD
jgi:hypothetical protein